MEEYFKEYLPVIKLAIGILIISLLFIIILYFSVISINLYDSKIHTNAVTAHAIGIIILTTFLIIVAWFQLSNLNETSKADFLLRLDDRYSSPEIIKARIIIQHYIGKALLLVNI